MRTFFFVDEMSLLVHPRTPTCLLLYDDLRKLLGVLRRFLFVH